MTKKTKPRKKLVLKQKSVRTLTESDLESGVVGGASPRVTATCNCHNSYDQCGTASVIKGTGGVNHNQALRGRAA